MESFHGIVHTLHGRQMDPAATLNNKNCRTGHTGNGPQGGYTMRIRSRFLALTIGSVLALSTPALAADADLVVFDLQQLRDRATFTEPRRFAEGVVHLFVNGRAAISNGTFIGSLDGRILRRGED